MDYKTEGVKLVADTATGYTIGEATDTNGLIITLFTIIGRIVTEIIINRRLKRKSKNDATE